MSSAARVGGDGTLRLFLALRLPDHAVTALASWSAAALTGGRHVPREQLHITLAFLGSRPSAELPEIVDSLRSAVAGCAPGPLVPLRYRETRSVGMIVLGDASGASGRLAGAVHDRLERLGVYRREARPWLPHMTVLRFRERPGLRPSLAGLEPFVPSDAAAFLSRLHPSGARYEVLAAVPLTAGRQSLSGEDRVGRNRLRSR